MRLPNLGIVVLIAAATGIGLLRRGSCAGHGRVRTSRPSSLAQLVILAVIPPVRTRPKQTGLTKNAAQPDLARPDWTVENRRLAVIS
jgi:hypothetical protein